jgi:hypothetical protein
VESAVHGDNSLGDGGEPRIAIQCFGLAREERRVAFDLDQVEAAGRIDDPLEQAPRGCLRVPEEGAVELHVLRVAADVGDQEEGTFGLHADANSGMDFQNLTLKSQSLEGVLRPAASPKAGRLAATPKKI